MAGFRWILQFHLPLPPAAPPRSFSILPRSFHPSCEGSGPAIRRGIVDLQSSRSGWTLFVIELPWYKVKVIASGGASVTSGCIERIARAAGVCVATSVSPTSVAPSVSSSRAIAKVPVGHGQTPLYVAAACARATGEVIPRVRTRLPLLFFPFQCSRDRNRPCFYSSALSSPPPVIGTG